VTEHFCHLCKEPIVPDLSSSSRWAHRHMGFYGCEPLSMYDEPDNYPLATHVARLCKGCNETPKETSL
jgi:hypothetical protein